MYSRSFCSACWVGLDGRTYNNRGGRQQYVVATDGVEWVRSGGGRFPAHSIPTGFREAPRWGGKAGSKIAYACRAAVIVREAFWREKLTRVGWTVDARTCSYVHFGVHKATTFDILSRLPSKAYKLDLRN